MEFWRLYRVVLARRWMILALMFFDLLRVLLGKWGNPSGRSLKGTRKSLRSKKPSTIVGQCCYRSNNQSLTSNTQNLWTNI